MSWPLRGTRRDTQTTTGRSASPYRDLTAAPPAPGRKMPVSTPGASHVSRAGGHGRQRACEARAESLSEIGEHVDGVADTPQQLPRARQHRPARFMAVGQRDDPSRPGRPQRWRDQPQRCGRPEQHAVAALALQDFDRTIAHRGERQHQRLPMPHHLERLAKVELGGTFPCGGIDDDPLGRHPDRQCVDEGLDASGTGREVVGDDQQFRHSAQVEASPAGATALPCPDHSQREWRREERRSSHRLVRPGLRTA